jgi:hypothetical protein
MRSLQGRFLAVVLAGYLDGVTLQQWLVTGPTSELLGPTVLSVLATLVALYTVMGS